MFELSEDDDYYPEDYAPPPYNKSGRILVNVLIAYEWNVCESEYDVLDYDIDSSVFWICEGVGFDWWFDQTCDFPAPGYYVIENITGEYIRGDGWTTDDDEEWEYGNIRPATAQEISKKHLL